MRDNFRCMRQGGELHILHAGVRECIHTFSFCRLQHDKMMHLASIYKTAGRLLYALLLFLGFITIVCVSIQSRVRSSVKAPGGASALNESTTPSASRRASASGASACGSVSVSVYWRPWMSDILRMRSPPNGPSEGRRRCYRIRGAWAPSARSRR